MRGVEEIAYILGHSEGFFVAEGSLAAVAERAVCSAAGSVQTKAALPLEAADLPTGGHNAKAWCEHDGAPPHVPVDDDDPIGLT